MVKNVKILTLSVLAMLMVACGQDNFETNSEPITEVEGLIKDVNGTPLPGVNVVVVGFKTGSVSNIEGRYKVSLPEGATKLEYSFIGLEKQLIEIQNKGVIDVVMSEGGLPIVSIPEGPYFKVSDALIFKDGKLSYTGQVYNRQGEFLSGVSVKVMYTDKVQSTVTDEKGNFMIEIQKGAMVAYFELENYESSISRIQKYIENLEK